jgi:hypothetical protein
MSFLRLSATRLSTISTISKASTQPFTKPKYFSQTTLNMSNTSDPAVQSAADRVANFEKEAENIVTKMATNPQAVTKEDADLAHSREHRAFGQTSKGGVAAQAQSLANENMKNPSATQSAADRVSNFDQTADQITDKLANAPETITKEDGDLAHSREQRAFGATHKGGLASQVQSQANANERQN